MNAKNLTRNAVMLALLIICSQITIPLPAVPLTLQTFAIGLIASLLPVGDTLLVIGGYLLLGSVGLPVFSSFTAGLAVILGPLGGYLIGFLLYGLVTSGWLKLSGNGTSALVLANLLGASVQLLIGAWWLKVWNGLNWSVALMTGVVPFVLPAIIKLYLVVIIVKRVRRITIFA